MMEKDMMMVMRMVIKIINRKEGEAENVDG